MLVVRRERVAVDLRGLRFIVAGQYVFARLLQLVPISGFEAGADILRFLVLPIGISIFARLGPEARFYRTISAKTLAFTTEVMKRDSFFGPDGLAVALLLDPTIVQAAEVHHVTVELGGAHARGQTIVDWTDGGDRPANARIILQVDQDKFNDLMALALR